MPGQGESTKPLSYKAKHYRVHRLRGKASTHACADCGKPAAHWSTVHGTDGTDPLQHYEPRCVRCHGRYDRAVKKRAALYTPEGRARIAAAAREARLREWADPEMRALRTAAVKAAWQRPEVREAMRRGREKRRARQAAA